MANIRQVRLAADIGGTFTDIVLDTSTHLCTTKILTTPDRPERGVMDGVDQVLRENGISPSRVGIFVHGTTLATNALIERKGAKTAFLTTEGFRDILETGFEKRFEQYDVFMDKPQPLVPRPLRLPVRERVSARGRVLIPLDPGEVRETAAILKEQNVEAVAVGLLHAYVFPDHEQQIRDILSFELPDATICLSSDVCPEIREYERFSTTCANAYVRPLMSGYLHRLQETLIQRGLTCPFFMMMSGGGLTTLENASRFPIRLVESGPAGGAILASEVARDCDIDEALSLDMGGTTAKICLIAQGQPDRARTFEVARAYRDQKGSGLPLRIPAIEMVEIGAGGGSIAHLDEMNRICVGPASAGAVPGPACYSRGGCQPTVTDANLVLGKLDPDQFAAGRIKLDPERSIEALSRDIGAPLDLDGHWPGVGVIEIVEENMANAVRVHAIERGRVIDRHALIAFGGAAPLHAGRLARKLGIDRVIVPKRAGVGSAVGFLLAPVSYEIVTSHTMMLSRFDAERINAILKGMREQAASVVSRSAPGTATLTLTGTVELRYAGQGHELSLTLDDGPLQESDAQELRTRFEALYRRIYGLTLDSLDVQAVTWAVTASTEPNPVSGPDTTGEIRCAAPIGTRSIYDFEAGQNRNCPVYWRARIQPGSSISGPAAIAEDETTTIVPTGFVAAVNPCGHIIMERRRLP